MTGEKLSPTQAKWVERELGLVQRMANKVRRQMGDGLGADLVSAGYEALVHAALRYRPESGVPFAAFAHYRVRGAMIDAIRKSNPTLRRQRRALQALEASQSILDQARKAQPDAQAQDTRSLRERVEAAAALVKQTTAAVALSRSTPREPDTLTDDAGANEERVGEVIDRIRLRAVLDTASEADRDLVEALYFEGLTMSEYADRAQVSVSTVSRHHAKAIARLARAMGVGGPGDPGG